MIGAHLNYNMYKDFNSDFFCGLLVQLSII